MNRSNKDELDPTLKEKLEAYAEDAPQRNPAAEKRTRDRFMAELNMTFEGAPVSNPSSRGLRSILMSWAAGLKQVKENLAMSFTQRTTMTIITSILVLATFLFGGGITASAASASLPGDALYPVKTSLENARASLTNDDAVKAGLFLGFAGRRLDEIKSLIASGRFDHVPQAASLFERDIEMAREAIRHLAEDHPARAAELDVQAASILKGFDDALNAMLSGAPVDVQPVLQDAMKASSSAVDSMDNANTNEDINDDHGNDNNSNANTNEDINNNDNSNANTNEDINNNDNGNDNSNENINNDNGNVNSNENINNDNGSNTNTNTNSNDKHGGKDGGGSGGGGGGGDGGGGGGGGGDSGGG